MDPRDHYDEIAALIAAVAKALEMEDGAVVAAIEEGRLTMEMGVDATGTHVLDVACDGRTARVAAGAVFRPGATA